MIRSCRHVGVLSCAAVLGIAGFAFADTGGVKNIQSPQADPYRFEPGTAPTASGPFHTRVPGCQPTANCQEHGTSVVQARASNVVGPSHLCCADNFTIAGTGNVNITQICFWGYYGAGAVADPLPAAGAESMRIRILPNNGGGGPGTPDTLNAISTIFVGANADPAAPGFDGTTYTGTLTRGAALETGPFGTPVYLWTVTGLNLSVPAGQCLWLEIGGATANQGADNRWRWADNSASGTFPSADGVIYQTNLDIGEYEYTDLVGAPGADRAFCLSSVLGAPSCNIPAAPANTTCATATNVSTFPFDDTRTNTLRSVTAATPFCGGNPVNANTIWYKITGNGTTITADTCGPNTDFDTVINVYCGTSSVCASNNNTLNCVANNDTGPAGCSGDGGANTDPSEVSFVATTGNTYYIAVFGFQLVAGICDVHIDSDGVQAVNPPSCVSDRCPLDISGITNVETDPCGTDNNAACTGTSVGTFVLGQTMAGTCYNLGANRDFDFWEYNTATPLPDNSGGNGSCYVLLSYQVEFPAIIEFFSGPCDANDGTFLGAAGADYRALNGVCGGRGIVATTTPAAPFRVNILPVDFGGLPCGASNNYEMSVALAVVGSCCQPGTACVVNPQLICLGVDGSVWTSGASCSPTSDSCLGVCCTGSTCVTSAATDCTAAGSTYVAGGTCSPNSCAAALGVCCRGATCNSTVGSSSCTGTGTAGAFFVILSTTCNSGAVSDAPCCFANYNKANGITVQDIFDFLSDWFAGSPFAKVGGDGTSGPLSVQNIFDFLTNWFNGGCT